MLKKIALGLLAVFAVMQFFRPDKNLAAAAPFAGPDDITALLPPPPDVRATLAAACYDCHSDHTRYPWYAAVQPLAWWLADHVKDGRRELNFSRFATYSKQRQLDRLGAVADEVRERKMPLSSYTWTHGDAQLTEPQVAALAAWAEAAAEKIGSH